MAATARRQSSSTSLAKFARVNSPDLSNRSLDFCNAFWGSTDGGVDVLFARMRGAGRTVEELRAFWKERAAIEEDYAKRMSKLAKQVLGKDEIGELKNSLDTLRLETDRQAISHANLALSLHSELEEPAGAFIARQTQFKRVTQAIIEKSYKNKQTQEAYVTKAREKYEADCMRINSYTAQSTLVQGKDLDKIQLKLDRAKQTVTANERDFANFARALQTTVDKWEKDWKHFCDACQDLEEERIEFMKDNVWAYANAVSTVCVSDDESCEKIRIALEQLEPERDMENFVRDYSTGNEIPDPPKFISYTNPETTSSANARQAPRYAIFPRISSRAMSMNEVMKNQAPEEEPTDAGMAGFGAGGGEAMANGDGGVTQPYTDASSPVNGTNEVSPTSVYSQATHSRGASRTLTGLPPAQADPNVQKTMISIGGNAYEVNPDQDPQTISPSSGGPTSRVNANVGRQNDPLAEQMERLRVSAQGSIRRNSVSRTTPGVQSSSPAPSFGSGGGTPAPSAAAGAAGIGPSALSAPAPRPANRDYRNSAELVVGGPPPSSRPTSPAGPPVAAHMLPPSQTSSSPLPVEEVTSRYEQALPGERRNSIIRGSSPGFVPGHSPSQSLGQGINRRGSVDERPRSREGFAGIGSGGRTPSPGPGPSQASQMNGQHPHPYRIPSPAPGSDLGISLDASGQVTHDRMAENFRQQQQQQQYMPPQPAQSPYNPQRQQSLPMTSPIGPPPATQPPYPSQYGQQQQFTQPQQTMNTPQNQWYNQQQPQQMQQPFGQTPQPTSYTPGPQGNMPPGVQRGPSMAMRQNSLGAQQSYNALPSTQGGYPQNVGGYQDPSTRRSPSPAPPAPGANAPTGQYINGRPILFYVKALYDYQASIDEEFDFQAGDVIAVTSTPEDGWWTGELLDDSRRAPGRTVFPSNFVCLF